MTLDALTFVLLHEIGHAFVAELKMGVTGGEEDAADELASLILIQSKKPDWAFMGTIAMVMLEKQYGGGDKPKVFDEHSSGEQRKETAICMIYGSDPNANAGIIKEYPEFERRAPRCKTEYERKDKAWTDLLKPHLRK